VLRIAALGTPVVGEGVAEERVAIAAVDIDAVPGAEE